MKKIVLILVIISFPIFSHQIDKKTINEIPIKKLALLKEEIMQKSGNNLKQYEGVYRFGPGHDMKVYLKDSTLRALLPGQPEYTLQWIGENEFKLKGLEGYKMTFNFDDNRKVVSVTSSQPNGDFVAQKIIDEVKSPEKEKTINLSTDQLKKFEGEYKFANGNDMKIFLENGYLRASLINQPEYKLLPVSEKEFILENMKGYKLIFEENTKGQVTGVISSQPDGKFKAKKNK